MRARSNHAAAARLIPGLGAPAPVIEKWFCPRPAGPAIVAFQRWVSLQFGPRLAISGGQLRRRPLHTDGRCRTTSMRSNVWAVPAPGGGGGGEWGGGGGGGGGEWNGMEGKEWNGMEMEWNGMNEQTMRISHSRSRSCIADCRAPVGAALATRLTSTLIQALDVVAFLSSSFWCAPIPGIDVGGRCLERVDLCSRADADSPIADQHIAVAVSCTCPSRSAYDPQPCSTMPAWWRSSAKRP